MQAELLKKTLATVTVESMTDGTMSTLWEMLPDMVSGREWVAEVVDCAERMSEFLGDEIKEEELQDLAHQFADSECEDYYKNINARVQALSLWAFSDLDEEVAEMRHGKENCSLTDLNSDYLYCAMRGLFQVVAQWAWENTEGAE
jgi:RecJ-like exonuclease